MLARCAHRCTDAVMHQLTLTAWLGDPSGIAGPRFIMERSRQRRYGTPKKEEGARCSDAVLASHPEGHTLTPSRTFDPKVLDPRTSEPESSPAHDQTARRRPNRRTDPPEGDPIHEPDHPKATLPAGTTHPKVPRSRDRSTRRHSGPWNDRPEDRPSRLTIQSEISWPMNRSTRGLPCPTASKSLNSCR